MSRVLGNRVYIREIITDYLLRTGWFIKAEFINFEVWHNHQFSQGEIVLPGYGVKDFDRRMMEAFTYILEFEKSNYITFG